MKNLKNLDSMEELLNNSIKLGEIDGINLYKIYREVEPLATLGQDVINLKKQEVLALLDKAMWAIRGIHERYERVEAINEQGRNVSESLRILQEKMAAYQKPFAEKGKKFISGKPKGSISERTKYIHELVKLHPNLSAKELLKLAIESRLGNLSYGRFKNIVTDAKKLL